MFSACAFFHCPHFSTLWFTSTTTISILEPISCAIIWRNLIENASDLKVIPIPFHVNLCFLISSSLCLSDHKVEVLALPWAEITHGNSAAESSYPKDSRFIKPTHSRLIYHTVVVAAGHLSIVYKNINHGLHFTSAFGAKRFKAPFVTFFGTMPTEKKKREMGAWDNSEMRAAMWKRRHIFRQRPLLVMGLCCRVAVLHQARGLRLKNGRGCHSRLISQPAVSERDGFCSLIHGPSEHSKVSEERAG